MRGAVAYSCAFPPNLDVVAKARLAQRLGYHRVWLFESPALHGDLWIGLARIAEATQRIDGRACQMRHLAGFAPQRPIPAPIWIAASGPTGFAAAHDLNAAGLVLTALPPANDTLPAHRALLRFGTVLRPGEDHTSPRVIEAAGPGYASAVHTVWQHAGDAVDTLPGGARWRATIDAAHPPHARHLAVHEGHLTSLTGRDRDLITAAGPALLRPGWTGDPDTIRGRLEEARAAGVTEVIYVPAGPDINGELEAFATAANG